MSEVNKIANYNQMMSWLTRPSVPKTETREDFAIGGGAIEGQNLGSREGFAGPQLIKSGVDKNKYTYAIRNPEYEGPGKGQSPTIKQGPFDTLEEAQKSFDTRQKKMSELKISGRNKAVTDKAQEINNFVNDFYDQNINKYDLRDYNSFKKDMLTAFEESGIKSGSGRKAILEGYPNIGNIDSKVPFEKYGVGDLLRTKGSSGTSKPTDTFFKKLFYSGKIETNPTLKKRLNDYLEYYNIDKKFYGDGAPIDRQALKKKYADTLNNLDDTLFLLGDDSIGTGKTRANILRKYFPDEIDAFIAKRSSTGELYKKNVASIENFLTEKQLKEALDGHTSIKKFMTSQTDQLKKIFDLSQLPPSLVFNADHVEGMTEIAKLDNPEDIIRGLKNLVGMTKQRNLNLGWGGYSQKRRDLTDKINQGINPQKNLNKLNKLTQESYPSELKNKKAYSLKNGVLTPTQDFNFISDPETRFKQYFTELTSTPEGLKALKSQYKDNPKLQEIVQTDPNLTSMLDNTYNKMIDVLKNPKFKSVLQNSGLTLRGLGQMRKGNIPGFLNTMEKLMQKNSDLRAELEYDFSDIQNQYASASMMSDVVPIEKKEKPKEGTTEGGSAAAAGGATLLGKYAKPLLKGALKTVGSLPVAGTFAGMTIKENLDEGKNIADAVVDPLVGIELLLPETVKKLGPLMARAARVSTPVGATITGLGTLKNRTQAMMQEADTLTKTPYQEDLIDEYAAKQYRGYELGGRVGFADGPEDPSKRKLMKIMAGLGSIPILGRFIDIGTTAQKTAPVVTEAAKSVPPYFFKLVEKIRQLGDDITGKASTQDREIVKSYKDYEMSEDLATGEIVIRKRNEGVFYDQDGIISDEYMTYKPGVADETTKTRPVDEYEEYTVRPDSDGKLTDSEDGLDSIEEILEEAGDPDSMTLKR